MSEDFYEKALSNMEATLYALALRVPQPQKVVFVDSYVYRYIERTIHQTIVQKLARCITGLKSARLLLEKGFFQEQAALQRVLDELEEDITFLSFAVIFGDVTELHVKYMNAFYEEDFDSATGKPTDQDRPMVPRKKIRAYIARMQGHAENPSGAIDSMRTVSKANSGYVHAASPHIMDMYCGNPPRFQVSGMLETFIHQDHKDDLWNNFYRGILAFAFAAKAFGDESLFFEIKDFAKSFAEANGRDYGLQ